METEREDPGLQICQSLAERLYNRIRDESLSLNHPFSGEPLPDGSTPNAGNGAILLPSRTEMQDLEALISLVLRSWIQSGKMPSVEQLHSSAVNMVADQVVYITMLYCTAMLGAFLPSICSGDLDMATAGLRVMTEIEEQATTSQNTLSRTRPTRRIGTSTPDPVEELMDLPVPPSAKADTKNTAGSASASKKSKKKKNVKTGGRKRKKKAK